MHRMVVKFMEFILRSFFLFYVCYWSVVMLCTVVVWYWYGPLALVILLGAFLFGELLFRIFMYYSYGTQYRYAIFTYFLQDNRRYGTGLQKGACSRELPFLLFDKSLFPPNSGRVLDLEQNKAQRNLFTVNSLGFRGKEFDLQRKGAMIRIFCVGGSTTAGDHNDDEETWPAQLEQKLRAAGHNIEVINAGVPGWDSHKDVARFRKEIVHYQPDVVLLHEGWNDEFNYSSLSLGRRWKPGILRNVREERMLYCAPSRFLSSDHFLTKLLFIQHFRKKFIFDRTMSFTNPRRWQVLRRREYISAWVENLIVMAQLAKQNDFLLYTIDYPALVSLGDSVNDRAVYVERSRLTSFFADYQAASKARISNTLRLCAYMIPLLSAQDFPHVGEERMQYFCDEMHLTPRGNAWLADNVAAKLMSDAAYLARYNGSKISNVVIDADTIDNIRAESGRNPYVLERFILGVIEALGGPKTKINTEIPTERYTTF